MEPQTRDGRESRAAPPLLDVQLPQPPAEQFLRAFGGWPAFLRGCRVTVALITLCALVEAPTSARWMDAQQVARLEPRAGAGILLRLTAYNETLGLLRALTAPGQFRGLI